MQRVTGISRDSHWPKFSSEVLAVEVVAHCTQEQTRYTSGSKKHSFTEEDTTFGKYEQAKSS